MDGNKKNEINEIHAGDIGTTSRLKSTETNHTLHEKGSSLTINPIVFPESRIILAIIVEDEANEEKISEALNDIQKEDPTIKSYYSKELKQLIIEGQGELHLNLVKWRLKNLYNLSINYVIIYRYTCILKNSNDLFSQQVLMKYFF